jgi:methionyl-tRNA formyltransferase
VAAGYDLVLAVTQPDRPGHRLRLTPPPVKLASLDLGIQVLQPERIRDEAAIAAIAEVRPDVMVVVAYGQIIPRPLLELPPRGILNVHASVLPRHRGAAPIAHALLARDRTTGVTIMQMDEQLDHGPILAMRETEIGPREDAPSLTSRLAALGADLLVESLENLDALEPREQDHAHATLAPKLTREMGELNWEMPAAEIDSRVRALQPWPGANLPFGNSRIKVLRGRVSPESGAPGKVLAVDSEGVVVGASKGAYRLEEVQVPGRRPMPARVLVAGDA